MSNAQALQQALAPKSDQLNADDLITTNKTIVISGVNINLGSEQKIIINYHGDNGKPWKPSKGMGRVLTEILGGDPDQWAGQTVELFRNKEIRFGKEKCGGIQICGMSAVRNVTTLLITTSKGKKSSITINPIAAIGAAKQQRAPAQQQQSSEQVDQNSAAAWGKRMVAARNLGSIELDRVWAEVPQALKPEMQEFYDAKFREARMVDIKNQPQEPEQQPAPANLEAGSIEDL